MREVLFKIKLLQKFLYGGTESMQILFEVLFKMRLFIRQILKRELRRIVEADFRNISKDRIGVHSSLFKQMTFPEDFLLRFFQDAVKALQNGKGQNYILILMLLPASTQELRNIPDEVGFWREMHNHYKCTSPCIHKLFLGLHVLIEKIEPIRQNPQNS